MWNPYPGYHSKYVIWQRRRQSAAERRAQREQQQKAAARYMRKIRAQIRVLGGLEGGSILAWSPLSDITHRTAEFFVTEKLLPGEELSLILEVKETIYLRAKVIQCHEYESTHRVITSIQYRYRLQVAFVYESIQEQTLFQEYLALAAA